ncbi:RNA polymerase II-associated factor 1-like protein [Aphelenchoides besseyi]|nr:RNA polymerase II-associated factor 1-like protein [Aphelenchoides besseyi]
MPLSRITQFAGESFGTDNVRVVYAGQEKDTYNRPSRTIVLVGPIGGGKSSLIDFLCNYFYGVEFDTKHRYKIADEIFDQTTPEKAVTKYVFNGTNMPYRPVVIDTPGIGDPTGLKANRELASVVTDYFNVAAKERIHAVGFVLPSFMGSVNDQIDSDIQLTLSLFPAWMHENIVPILTFSNESTTSNDDLLRHFGLANHAKFFVNTNSVFDSPSEDHEEVRRQRALWELTTESVRGLLNFVGELRPQTIERKLLSGDATPVSPLSPIEQQVEEQKPAQFCVPTSSPLGTSPSSPTHGGIKFRETDEFTAVREETIYTEIIRESDKSPQQSIRNNESVGQKFGIPTNEERRLKPIPQSSFPLGPPPSLPKKFGQETKTAQTQPSPQQQTFQSELGQKLQERQKLGQSFNANLLQFESQGIPLSPSESQPSISQHRTSSQQKPLIDPLNIATDLQQAIEMRNSTQQHSGGYPYDDNEEAEYSNLELLRRYIYDPSSRTYRIQYVHEVSTRESRRSSGRQSLRASESDLRSPRQRELPQQTRHAAPSGGLDDSFLGTLADELRRQGDYNDGRLTRNTSAPHLETEFDKENARRIGIDYSPEALKKMLNGFNTQKRDFGQHSPNRPQVIRKPYEQPRGPELARHQQDSTQQPIRIPITTTTRPIQPLRQQNGQQFDRDYADEALRQAREHRSASHAVPADLMQQHTPTSADRSFDEKERLFERNASARQSFHNSSIRRGGVRSAMRSSRPSAEGETSGEDWDLNEKRRVQSQAQPRKIEMEPLKRSTPPRAQSPSRWTTQPQQQVYPGTATRASTRDVEAAYETEERRPLQQPLNFGNKRRPKKATKTKEPKVSVPHSCLLFHYCSICYCGRRCGYYRNFDCNCLDAF